MALHAGDIFVLNRRYEEGIQFFRKAIELQPDLWSAHSQLGINLMRLGFEEEAKAQLEDCYQHHYRDAATVNTLTLLDSYKNFVTYRNGNTILKLHRKEAELLRHQHGVVLRTRLVLRRVRGRDHGHDRERRSGQKVQGSALRGVPWLRDRLQSSQGITVQLEHSPERRELRKLIVTLTAGEPGLSRVRGNLCMHGGERPA